MALFPPLNVEPVQLFQEVERELAVRKDVYPRWVTQRKLTQHQADHRIKCMEDLLTVLESLFGRPEPMQTKLEI
jgi:hypothetical protein